MPGFNAVTWLGLLAPAGTSEAFVDRLSAEVNKLMKLPEVQDRLTKLGAEHQENSRQQFGAFLRKEIDEQGAVIRSAGIKTD